MGMSALLLFARHASPASGVGEGPGGMMIVGQSGPVDGCPEWTWTSCYDPETGYSSSTSPPARVGVRSRSSTVPTAWPTGWFVIKRGFGRSASPMADARLTIQ